MPAAPHLPTVAPSSAYGWPTITQSTKSYHDRDEADSLVEFHDFYGASLPTLSSLAADNFHDGSDRKHHPTSEHTERSIPSQSDNSNMTSKRGSSDFETDRDKSFRARPADSKLSDAIAKRDGATITSILGDNSGDPTSKIGEVYESGRLKCIQDE